MKQQRVLTTAALVAASALALTGCAGSTAGSSESIELWLPPFSSGDVTDEDAWDDILADFETEHDVDVNVTIVPWDSYEEKYLTGVTSGQGPDVGYMYTEMLGDYVQQGAVVAMDEYLGDTDSYLYLEQGQIEGEQFAMPFVVGGARVLYYNADLLAQAGIDEPPATWDDFLSDSQTLLAAGITPTVQTWGEASRTMLNESYFPLLWQAGGELFTEDGTATAFNSEAGLEAAEFLMELIDSGAMASTVTSLTTPEAQQMFTNGQVAFFVQDDALLPVFEKGDFELGFVDSLTNERKGTFVASDSLVLLDKCADKQLCTDLIAYITSGPQMAKFHEIAPYPPITDDEEFTSAVEFKDVYEQSDMLFSLPMIAGGAAAYNSLYTNLQQMILGEKSPEQALEDAAAEGDAALESAVQ